jgi:BirA family transcriptional regulator, biotin operon repressor / biotin---[acetyl-CoA-carboxylase] ligase
MTLFPWDAETLWQDLEPLAPGLSVEVLAETDSTNTHLMERARRGDTLPCLLVAACQRAGRGRLGRPWWSQPGQSLTFSLGLRLAPTDWSGLSLAVGLALAEALGEHTGLKWPNDLWLRGDDRKLGGILVEVAPLAEPGLRPGERWVVIGAGLNVAPLPDGQASADTFRTGYACLQEFEPLLTPPQLLHRVARPLLEAVLAFETDGLSPRLRTRYAARDVLAGRTVQAGSVTGVACGLSVDGSLQVRDAHGTVHALHSGEVSVRPC